MQTHHQSLINRQTVIMNHHANSILLNNTFVFWCWKLRSTSSLSLDEQKFQVRCAHLPNFYQIFSLGFVQRPPKLQLLALCTMVDLCFCLICCCFCFVFMSNTAIFASAAAKKELLGVKIFVTSVYFLNSLFFPLHRQWLDSRKVLLKADLSFFDSCKGRKEKKHFHVWAKTILEVFF